jgi:HlyD family secretion protein
MSDTTAATEELKKALAAEEGGRRWLRRLAIAGGIAVAFGGALFWRAAHRPPPPAKFVTAQVTTGDVVEKVQATGTVQPLLQVNVGAQVNGRVTRVLVDFNSVVKKGDVLAEIDPTIYGTQVNAQAAQVMAQRAQMHSAQANLESLKAQMATAKVALDRVQRLFDNNLASKADLDGARGTYDSFRAQVDSAAAQVSAAQASIGAGQAQLTQSMTNVGYTKIYAPVDGVVVTRGIDPGATVVASFQSPVLFVIAQDLRKMRVLADVDEADVGRLKEQMDADAVVDAFPGESFHGIVSQIRFSPNNVQGVVTYSAVVEVDNPEEKLRPGMTATITVKTREAKGVLKIPNAALRYKPSPPLGPDGRPVPQPPEAALAKGQGRVFLITNDKQGEEKDEAKIIGIGVTDGIATEIMPGGLESGAKVVTDENESDEDKKKKKKGS